MTGEQLIARRLAACVPVYQWRYADGTIVGCGTRAEYEHWSREGTLDGVVLGQVITHEPASEDACRAALWARL